MRSTDFLVIGGGIVGASIARELKRRYATASVTLIDKEAHVGMHASGRNSGVLHAGFYYTADSLKARFTRDGNRELTEYCLANNLDIRQCGKLVVARNEDEDRLLDELAERGRLNGVELEMVSADDAARIEPRARTYSRALYSPNTSSADPGQVIRHLHDELASMGVDVLMDTAFVSRRGRAVRTSVGTINAGHVVNAAGLYADQIAKAFGFSEKYAILPFKGLYLKSTEPPGSLRTHIYPVPDLKYPFLGVHFTIQVNGSVKIGPTAIPAFWRENYRGLERFSLSELIDIGIRAMRLLGSPHLDLGSLAWEEGRKFFRRRMVQLAAELCTGVEYSHYRTWAPPGIRAQLVDTEKRALVMDFIVEGDMHSTHILNAVSPGWTCAFPFARYVVDQMDGTHCSEQAR